jgi:hypothetical protein
MSAFSLTRKTLACVGSLLRLSLKLTNWKMLADIMKILSSLIAFASLASLACGCAFTLVLGPVPALLGFAGFVSLGALAVYLNPEL